MKMAMFWPVWMFMEEKPEGSEEKLVEFKQNRRLQEP